MIKSVLIMAHENVEKTTSASLMLPREESEKVVVVPGQGVGKFLIREDTILNGISGFAGCGRTQFACAGVKKEWSALCWGQQSDKKYYCLLVTLSATFALSLIGTIFFCFTNTVNDAILSNMVITNNSLAYSMWKRPTVHPLMKVHVFNYTNWKRVRQGLDKKLHVEDVGPYVYSQQIERVNVKFQGDHLTFQERNNFKFMPELSTGAHFDQLYVPNLPLLGVIAKTINLPHLGQLTVQSTLTFADHNEAFLKLPVQRFLWGYDDTIMDLARPFLSLKGQLNYDKFGLLVSKNGTTSDRITINTGEKHINKMNIIEKVNGNEMLPHWGSPECNSISASDGTMFPPSLLDKKTTLYVFYSNLCRRLPFEYIKDVEIRDSIHLMRYGMPENVFDDPEKNPANQCYCDVDSGTCPPRGIVNITACAMGAPVVVSYPHFHRGDPKLREDLTGLSPDSNLHESYLDIHPTLGIALSGRSSLQLNIQIKKTGVFDCLRFLPEGIILPIAWIQMSVEELPESLQSLVYHGTFSTAAAQLGLALVCSATLLVSSVCLLVIILTRRKKPCLTVKLYPELPN